MKQPGRTQMEIMQCWWKAKIQNPQGMTVGVTMGIGGIIKCPRRDVRA